MQGDCIKLMETLSDNSIDLILCDLPYNKTHNSWDSEIDFEKLWDEYNRIIKEHGAIVLFGQTNFSARLIMSNEKLFRYTLIWDKVRKTGFLNANRMPLRQHEDILVFYKRLPTYNPQMQEGGEPSHSRGKKWNSKKNTTDKGNHYGAYNHNYAVSKRTTKYPSSILTFPNKVQGNLHPTQKPVALLEYLIKTYTNEEDIVLDNCMGSGSTGVACANTNRNFIGMELNSKYYNIAKDRIEKAVSRHE